MKTYNFSTTLRLSVSSLAMMAMAAPLAAPAFAQDADEIIVTATRRAESVQDVPINISVVGASAIEELGITDLA